MLQLAIEYYNYSVNLQNKTLSGLILCNADDSNLTNITITWGKVGSPTGTADIAWHAIA